MPLPANYRNFRASGGQNMANSAPNIGFPPLSQNQVTAAIPATALTPVNRISPQRKPSVPQYQQTPQDIADGNKIVPYGGYKRGGVPQFAAGGPPTSSQMAPWYTRSETRDEFHPGGLFGGSAPGRADTLPRDVPVDSHVIPADVVSALGQGNTLAGGNVLTGMFHSLPYGISGSSHNSGNLSLPHLPPIRQMDWQGGRKSGHGGKTVPIAASSGEFNVNPAGVYKTGMKAAMNMKLDPKKLTARKVMDLGHDCIDAFIVNVRKKEVKAMKSRPGPRKD